MGRLEGRVALITGAASEIGAATAAVFRSEGCSVVITDIDASRGLEASDALGPCVLFLPLDVTEESDWSAAVERVVAQYGRIDILVNNAGTAIEGIRRIDEETPAGHRRTLSVCVTGTWHGIRAVIPSMRSKGAGSIVNVSSINGLVGVSGMASYSAAKFAVTGLTRTAALELGNMGIRVNAIHPGITDTPGVASFSTPAVRAALNQSVTRQPIKRLADPAEIARAILFFASDDSSYCTGASLVVDGGHIIGRYRDLSD